MTHAIRFHQTGGPDVLKWESVEVGEPGPGQALVRHRSVGLNYIDIYHRSGVYPVSLPAIPGIEAAGVVEAVGPGVTEVKVGDRVAYAGGPLGAYSEARVMPADRLVAIPGVISDGQAAAMMLQGMTAQYLLRHTYPVKKGDTILVHAAAGGVGLIMCQWAHALGATVIGTVSTEEKAQLARAHGCDHTILYTQEDFQQRVMDITEGKKVQVVYDSVGKDTFAKSLDCLAPLGMLALFGQSSGVVPPFDLNQLAAKGSLFITRPTLATYTARRSDLVACAAELFEVVEQGLVKITINQRYPLREAIRAHRDLEGRKTTGSTIFTV
jgi:NADPH2:quinone reductase